MLPNVIKIKPQGTETEMQLRGYIRCRGTSSNNHTQKKAQTMLNTVFCAFSLVRMLAFWYVQLFVFFLWKCIVHRFAIFGHRCKGTSCYTSDSGRCFAPRPPVCSFVKLLWWTLLHLRCLDESVADIWDFEDMKTLSLHLNIMWLP